MERKRNTKKILLGLIAFAVVIALMAILYQKFKQEPTKGSKQIVAEVILADGSSQSYEIQTDAEFLRYALEEIDLISGTESEFGLYVTTVDGVTIDEGKQEWWCFTLNGDSLNTGVDLTPISDGEHYEITLTVGW